MKKAILLFTLTSISFLACAQNEAHKKEIRAWQQSQNEEFKDPERSPLTAKDLKDFEGHSFHPIDEAYRVKAQFEPTPKSQTFSIPTNKGTQKRYRRIGKLHFQLKGEKHTIEAYVPVQGFGMAAISQHVFIPISDPTNGTTTYDAGRYLHIDGVPASKEWVLDFNKLYNPFCAYNANFECPVVPEPNRMDIPIEAGVKGF